MDIIRDIQVQTVERKTTATRLQYFNPEQRSQNGENEWPQRILDIGDRANSALR